MALGARLGREAPLRPTTSPDRIPVLRAGSAQTCEPPALFRLPGDPTTHQLWGLSQLPVNLEASAQSTSQRDTRAWVSHTEQGSPGGRTPSREKGLLLYRPHGS